MTSDALRAFYAKRAAAHASLLENVNSEISLISNLRLATAILFLILLYFALNTPVIFLPVGAIALLFIILIVKHARLFARKRKLENLVAVNNNELQYMENNLAGFDNGAQFLDHHHPFSHDLDIFGDGSLYQVISRCHTRGGKRKLAERLSSRLSTIEEIKQHQDVANELSENPDFLEDFQSTAMNVEERDDDREQLRQWITHKPFLYGNNLYRFLLIIGPAVTLLLMVLAFVFDGVGRFFWMSAILQWIFLGFHLKKVNSFHQYVSRKKEVLSRYADILEIIEKKEFKSHLLKNFGQGARSAHEKLSRLASLVHTFDARTNFLTTFFVNGLLMFDLQCVYRLEKWKEQNAGSLEGWLRTVDEFEVMSSFGTFAFNNEKFVMPAINMNGNLSAIGLGHPLIPANERVANDIVLSPESSIVIITGANMAGKSTFLRTLGVNFVLALNGVPVCAEKFDCPLLELRTGMRTADSLRDHQSYFYAELNRLKSIMDEIREGKKLLVLLDEILKGTNSTDKQAGSIALVKQLIEFSAHVIIATHDLALGALENEYKGKVRNYCFEPSIVDDQLSFDYKLKKGVAEKMNATFLMRKMGIIPH